MYVIVCEGECDCVCANVCVLVCVSVWHFLHMSIWQFGGLNMFEVGNGTVRRCCLVGVIELIRVLRELPPSCLEASILPKAFRTTHRTLSSSDTVPCLPRGCYASCLNSNGMRL